VATVTLAGVTKVLRGVGWTLISVGVLILLYLVYLLFFTTLTTDRAQRSLLEEWELSYGAIDGELAEGPADTGADDDDLPADPGDAYAVIWFERPSTGERILHEDPLFVVEGVTRDHHRPGPGHNPASAAPGEDGNFAVSGHRTTYGAPFYDVDQLEAGDEVHVLDRDGERWVYEVREQRIVQPADVWVVGPDPLGTAEPTLTLTTCHPRFSAAQRLIVFATLRSEAEAPEDAVAS
jgi:sortase A